MHSEQSRAFEETDKDKFEQEAAGSSHWTGNSSSSESWTTGWWGVSWSAGTRWLSWSDSTGSRWKVRTLRKQEA